VNEFLININQVEYTNVQNGAIIHIFGRDSAGKLHKIDVTGFKPYFYAPLTQADSLPAIRGSYIDINKTYTTIKGQQLRRIYTIHPTDVREMRTRYQHFEADIPFATRFMIDQNVKSGIKVLSHNVDYNDVTPVDLNYPARVCVADIECEDTQGFPEPERDAITAITTWDSFTDEYITFVTTNIEGWVEKNHKVIPFSDEKSMLNEFMNYIKQIDPDILTGWNFTDFDLPYILKRTLTIGMDPAIMARLPGKIDGTRSELRGRNIFDLLSAYKKIHVAEGQLESYRLDAVAEHELGERKIRYTGTLTNLLKTDPKKFVEYNYKDVELCVNINKKSNIIEFYREISRYVGCPLDKSLNTSSVIDIYVLRKVNGKYVLPSRGNISLDSFEGALVFDASMGLKENVGVFDLKSLYPMSMMTLNASPETKDEHGDIHSPNGVRFKSHPDGLTRSIVAELLKERDLRKAEMKKLKYGTVEYENLNMQQNVIKVIMNTYYGVSGYPRFRLYDHDIGGAVTSTGRAIIEYTKKIIEENGYKVAYGDSVTGDMKIPIVNAGNIEISTLFSRVDYTSPDGKEYCNLKDVYTETVDNWGFIISKQVPYIMRHKCNKNIYKLYLKNTKLHPTEQFVAVTEDHSIYQFGDKKVDLIKPSQLSTHLLVHRGYTTQIRRMMIVDQEIITNYTDYVYDIEVADTHSFFANGILVHNTDSSFLEFPKDQDIVPLALKLEKQLNESYPKFAKDALNADVSYFSTKFEKIYRRFYQAGKKKRYAGHLVWKEGETVDKIDVVGFEFKRSDSPKITRDTQKTFLTMILRGSTREEIQKYMTDIMNSYRTLPLDEIGIPGGVGKSLSDYEIADAHIRGCKYSNEYLGTRFARGSKPKRVYIKTVTSKYPRTDVVCFEYGDQLPKEFVIDYDTMIEKTLKQPISRIAEPMGWSWNDFDPSVTTLASFGFE
jgi:DNA polymerase elongation subunit (family B)